MSVTFYPGKQVESASDKPCWTWVGDADEFVNLSNGSASEVVRALGLSAFWDCEQSCLELVQIEVFEARATALLRNSIDRPSAMVETRVSQEPGRATMIYAGRPQGWLQDVVMRLQRSIKVAKAAGATHVYGA